MCLAIPGEILSIYDPEGFDLDSSLLRTGRVSLGTSEAKTNATPANEPIAFPLTPDAIHTPVRSTGTAPRLLMQSSATRTPRDLAKAINP